MTIKYFTEWDVLIFLLTIDSPHPAYIHSPNKLRTVLMTSDAGNKDEWNKTLQHSDRSLRKGNGVLILNAKE